MPIKTPYFPGFHRLCGRTKKPAAVRLKEQLDDLRGVSPGQWERLFSPMISVLTAQRKRVFDRATTFWAFLGQVLQSGSCRNATREVQAWRYRHKNTRISSANSAYCQARKRLDVGWLEQLAEQSAVYLQRRSDQQWNWYDRRVVLVDGTSCQMPDTAENQDAYPQSGEQKPGCGMPIMQLVGLFDLANGALLKWACSPWFVHEASLFDIELSKYIRTDDVVVADRAYGSYLNLSLLQAKGADAVMRLHQARKVKFPAGQDEVVVNWSRPSLSSRPDHYSAEEWSRLPEQITVRVIRLRIQAKGFRTKEVILVTTLLDTPVEQIAQLYLRRWQIEVCFRDIKTTLGMELLRGKSPDICEKEVIMHLLAYNLLRSLMVEAARWADKALCTMSFTGTRDSVRQWVNVIALASSRRRREHAIMELYRCIAQDPIPIRPNRIEPRAVKRRPKGYQLLNKPRHLMEVSPSRRQK